MLPLNAVQFGKYALHLKGARSALPLSSRLQNDAWPEPDEIAYVE